ncbi:MAG TPA: PilZ domain-containing protein [Rhodanobacteraceae bacterium]
MRPPADTRLGTCIRDDEIGMTASGDFYTRIDHPPEVDDLLETLCQPGRASLRLDGSHATPLPVVVKIAHASESLCLDISAMRTRPESEAVRAGQLFRVIGQNTGGIVRTPPLTAERVWEDAECLYCQCVFPAYLETRQRRDTFRAKLHEWMHAKADLRDADIATTGILRDLSLNGCLVEFDASAATILDGETYPLHLEMLFPDGTRFEADALPRHQTLRHQRILCGFSLDVKTREQEHRIWHLVREIEREAARNAASGKRNLKRSLLFEGDALDNLAANGEGTGDADANAQE